MSQKIHRSPGGLFRGQPVIAKNSGVFSYADPVGLNSSGLLETVEAGQSILGWANETKTVDSDNATVAKYKPEYIPAENLEIYLPASADCEQADLYNYKDFSTVTSGAFVVGMTDITGGQVKVIAFDPYSESDNDAVIVVAAEIEKLAFAKA